MVAARGSVPPLGSRWQLAIKRSEFICGVCGRAGFFNLIWGLQFGGLEHGI